MAKRSARTSSAIAITGRRGGKIDPTLLFERRWVIYNGYAEPSTIPPSWHGWMHHTVDTPPTEETYKPRRVAEAAPAEYDRHAGCVCGRPARRSPPDAGRKATGDYKAWNPER